MKQVEVQIMQQSYLLACPEGREDRLLEAVKRLDTAMCKIRDAGKVRARERIAVLAALNFAFELADQAAAPSPSPSPMPTPAADASEHHAAAVPEAVSQRLGQLIDRLDQALERDGQLL